MKWLLLVALLAVLLYYLWSSQQDQQGGATLPDFSTSDSSDPLGSVISTVSDAINNGIDAITGRSTDAVVRIWADAIEQHEGYYPGSRSYRNNNPGNLRGAGDLGSDAQGFAVYSTYTLGRNALESDLRAKLRKYPDWTITQIMGRYAPSSDGNNVQAYAAAVAGALGVTPDTMLSDLSS